MNLRYHNTDLPHGRCLSVITIAPQQRTILSLKYDINTGEDQTDPVRVWFPHTVFLFQYSRVPGGFRYGGLNRVGNGDSSLHVYFSNNPLTSVDDKLGAAPTEHHHGGAACTDHVFDNYVFKSPRLLMGTILNSWWGSPHLIAVLEWVGWNSDGVMNHDWNCCYSIGSRLPEDVRRTLIDQPVGVLPYITRQELCPDIPVDRYYDPYRFGEDQ